MNNHSFQQRIKFLQAHLSAASAIILAKPADIRYLTGFQIITDNEREAYLVITKNEVTLLYPSFSPVTKLPFITYHAGHWPSDLRRLVVQLSSRSSQPIDQWQADLSNLFADEYQLLASIPKTNWQQFDKDKIIQLRMIKDTDEIKLIQAADEITRQATSTLLSSLKPGVTELELAHQFEYSIKKLGASKVAFPPVIAFGAHSALPHHQPTSAALEANQAVLIDVGAQIDGYCSDLTRTEWFGDQPDPLFEEIKTIVDQAYQEALRQVKPGSVASQVDEAARNHIGQHKYGPHFIHSTGHGLGLEIHEPPSVFKSSDQQLQKNMVITVEPGIYLDGKFGYRYENTIVV